MDDRINNLQAISGLEVRCRKEKGENVFEFFYLGRNVKTCFTYQKAKCFAEGVAFGKSLWPNVVFE